MSTVTARVFLFLILSVGAAHLLAGQSIPRMPDGKPKFSGVWAGPAFLHVVGPDDTDTPRVTSFDRSRMAPFLPGAEAKFFQRPRQALAPYAQQIVQTSDAVIILYEYMHFFRVIPIGKPHPADVELTFMGDAVATWDGDMLVIDTIGLREWTLSASNGWHSDALHT